MKAFRLAPQGQRQSGQILVMFLISLLALVLVVLMVVNTGDQVAKKARVQNAVDAVVISEASWIARSLNMMSMNNVAITQAFGIHTIMFAL
ncbi:MAG: Flp pilus assembly protein TadG, partial [Planctomycetota bacterium]